MKGYSFLTVITILANFAKKDLTELPTERILDHKIPLSQLGSNKLTNIWLLCSDCDKNKKSEILPCAIDARLKELQNGRKTTIKRIAQYGRRSI